MDITKSDINFLNKGGFDSLSVEGRKHVKILPYLSIVQATEGSYDIAIGNGSLENTGEGGFFVDPAQVQQTIVHHVNEKSGKMSARWIFIDVEINKSCSLDSIYRFPSLITAQTGKELNLLFDAFFQSEDIWKKYSLCYDILGFLMSLSSPIEKRNYQGIDDVIVYIKENFSQVITISELAKSACMSESNFFAAFKKRLGVSPIAYLNNYRLSVAAERLCSRNDTISAIASSVGIQDSLYFSRLFKKVYGIAPKEYRETYKGNK